MLVILKHPRGRRILLRARVSDFKRRSRGGASFVASVAGLQPTRHPYRCRDAAGRAVKRVCAKLELEAPRPHCLVDGLSGLLGRRPRQWSLSEPTGFGCFPGPHRCQPPNTSTRNSA